MDHQQCSAELAPLVALQCKIGSCGVNQAAPQPQGGTLELNGQTPLQLGVTRWRTLVTYVPQTRVHPPGTPAEFYFSVQVQHASKLVTASINAHHLHGVSVSSHRLAGRAAFGPHKTSAPSRNFRLAACSNSRRSGGGRGATCLR